MGQEEEKQMKSGIQKQRSTAREAEERKEGQEAAGHGLAEGASVGQRRMANLELLRCVAMMMVIVLHYLGKGNLLADLTSDKLGAGHLAAWLLECFCIVAVNVYMLISGYFLCQSSFKPGRLIQLWMQIWTYSVVFGLVGALSGVMTETAFDLHYLLTLVFPVSMGHYWFMSAYVFFYLLLPLAGMAVRKMTRKQLQVTLGFLLFAFCVVKSVLPVRFELDSQGYDCLWYLCVFLTAAYIRRFGLAFLEKKGRCLTLYAGSCLLIFAGTMGLRQVYLRTGSLERMLKMFLEYNHILPFAAAVGLFCFFCKLRTGGKLGAVVTKIGPYTLGVYLLHENMGLRYAWQNWLGAGKAAAALAEETVGSAGILLLWTGAAVAAVFICGILTDIVRKRIFGLLHRGLGRIGLYRSLVKKIEAADQIFCRYGI